MNESWRLRITGEQADAIGFPASRREDTKVAQGETPGKVAVAEFPPRRGEVKRNLDGEIQCFIWQTFDPPLPGQILLFLHPTQGSVRCGRLHPGLFSLTPYGSYVRAPCHEIAPAIA